MERKLLVGLVTFGLTRVGSSLPIPPPDRRRVYDLMPHISSLI